MVLDPVGKGNDTTRDWAQNARLLVDGTKHNYAHLLCVPESSQYVEPGAKFVGTTGGDALAFKNPNG